MDQAGFSGILTVIGGYMEEMKAKKNQEKRSVSRLAGKAPRRQWPHGLQETMEDGGYEIESKISRSALHLAD